MEQDKQKAEKDGGTASTYYEAFAYPPEKQQAQLTDAFLDHMMPGSNWFNPSWSKRAPIQVSVSSGSTAADFQAKFTVNYDSDMQTDFDDLRFIDDDQTTNLPYYIESKTDGSSAVVWVKIKDPITATPQIVYMYYGNPSASSESNGDNTFLFFDDCNDGVWNNKWTADGASISESGGILDVAYGGNYAGGAISINTINGQPIIAEFRIRRVPSGDSVYFRFDSISTNDFVRDGDEYDNGYGYNGHQITKGGDNFGSGASDLSSGTTEWRTYRAILNNTSFTSSRGVDLNNLGETKNLTLNTSFNNYVYKARLNRKWNENIQMDWVQVRKYASPEPTVNIGAEE